MSRPDRHTQRCGSFVRRQAGEESKLNQFRSGRVSAGQLVQRVAQVNHVHIWFGRDYRGLVQLLPAGPAAPLGGLSPAGAFDEDAAHGLGGRREEVAAVIPPRGVGRANQPQVRLVDEGRRLEGLPRLLRCQLIGSEFPQFVVDEREQIRRRLRVTGRSSVQKSGYVGHTIDFIPGRAGYKPETPRHGLQRSRREKKRFAELAIEAHPDWSGRQLAEGIHLSHVFVEKARKEMKKDSGGNVSTRNGKEQRTDKTGRKQAATKSKEPADPKKAYPHPEDDLPFTRSNPMA